MPAAARVNDMVYTHDPHAPDDHYGTVLVGSPNVFINEGNAFVPKVSIPAATTAAIMAATEEYASNPQQPKNAIEKPPEDDQSKDYNQASPELPPGQGGDTTAADTPTPNETGGKFSFVGGNQSVKAVGQNNPVGGAVTHSWSSGWTPAKGGIVAVIRPKSSASVLSFLSQCLSEGSQWYETGMGGAASNPKITNIWKELGVGTTGPWASDQTAWCAGFVNYALKKSGLAWTPQAGAKATAASLDKLNATRVDVKDMQPGDIVLWSYSHVNFCYRRFD